MIASAPLVSARQLHASQLAAGRDSGQSQGVV